MNNEEEILGFHPPEWVQISTPSSSTSSYSENVVLFKNTKLYNSIKWCLEYDNGVLNLFE